MIKLVDRFWVLVLWVIRWWIFVYSCFLSCACYFLFVSYFAKGFCVIFPVFLCFLFSQVFSNSNSCPDMNGIVVRCFLFLCDFIFDWYLFIIVGVLSATEVFYWCLCSVVCIQLSVCGLVYVLRRCMHGFLLNLLMCLSFKSFSIEI